MKPHEKPMSGLEQKILVAFKYTLKEDVVNESVLQDMLDAIDQNVDETSHLSQFRWEGIDDAFKLKVAGSPFEDSITSSFFQTHSYKYLDDPAFKLSFEREMRQRALPELEITSALGYVDGLVTDLKNNPSEQDSGWNPNMKEIADMTMNADSRKSSATDPFTGGGVYPEGDTYDKGTLEGF